MIGVIERFGVLGVFLLMVPESACVPIPSEVTLLFSGFAAHRGWMSFPLAVLAATLGNLLGSLLAYVIGAAGLLRSVPLAGAALERWGRLLDRYGMRAVLFARLLPLARTFVSLPAGDRRVPLLPFIALTTTGCALWATAFMLAGSLAGSAWSTVSSVGGRVALGIGVLALALTFLQGKRRVS
jgi:membrane protein DedA with SNARE-associated domain